MTTRGTHGCPDSTEKKDNESFHVRGGEHVTPRMFTLPLKVSACFRSSSSVVQALADAARARRDESAHRADALQRRTYCSELALQGGRVVKEGGAEELQHTCYQP